MKLVLFLGPHKTGTTSYQRWLRDENKILQNKSIGYIDQFVNKDIFIDYYKAVQKFFLDNDYKYFEKHVAAFLSQLTKIHKKELIVFNENLLGPMIGHKFAGNNICRSIYPSLKHILNVCTRLNEERNNSLNIEVIFFKKPFHSWIKSVYLDNFAKENHDHHSNNYSTHEEFLDCMHLGLEHEFSSLFNFEKLNTNFKIFQTQANLNIFQHYYFKKFSFSSHLDFNKEVKIMNTSNSYPNITERLSGLEKKLKIKF